MRIGASTRVHSGAAGFSMIEMLMAAFILAIGILGLTLLQSMSLRSAGGSKNVTVAVRLAEQVMDQVEQEGRLTYNNASVSSGYVTTTALTGLQYINQANVDQYFNYLPNTDPSTGNVVQVAATSTPLFHLNMAQTVAAGVGLSDVTVTVTFTDGINKVTNAPIVRTSTITRRILHA